MTSETLTRETDKTGLHGRETSETYPGDILLSGIVTDSDIRVGLWGRDALSRASGSGQRALVRIDVPFRSSRP